MTDRDREMFKWVRAFNAFDLYSSAIFFAKDHDVSIEHRRARLLGWPDAANTGEAKRSAAFLA